MSDLETVERIAALETQYVKDQMLIDRLNRRNAELLDALKKVLSFFGYSDSMAADFKAVSNNPLTPIVVKAAWAEIEKAEKQ
jgi:hypothetical protein